MYSDPLILIRAIREFRQRNSLGGEDAQSSHSQEGERGDRERNLILKLEMGKSRLLGLDFFRGERNRRN